jgi:hypothetical protein
MCKLFLRIKNLMANFASRLSRVLAYYQGERQNLLDQVAQLQERLVVALADAAADDETVAAAQAEAAAAREVAATATAEAARLQALVDADTTEDAALETALAAAEAQLPAEEPTV